MNFLPFFDSNWSNNRHVTFNLKSKDSLNLFGIEYFDIYYRLSVTYSHGIQDINKNKPPLKVYAETSRSSNTTT